MTKIQESKMQEITKEEFWGKIYTILEIVKPISKKMMSHHDLSTKPIKEVKRLIILLTEFLTFCDNNKNSKVVKRLDKKVRSILLFQKGPFRSEIFRIEATSVYFQGESIEQNTIIEIINNLKHYQETVPFGEVKIDPNFSKKHRNYHQLVSYVRTSIIDMAQELEKVYEKGNKPSRLSFLKRK